GNGAKALYFLPIEQRPEKPCFSSVVAFQCGVHFRALVTVQEIVHIADVGPSGITPVIVCSGHYVFASQENIAGARREIVRIAFAVAALHGQRIIEIIEKELQVVLILEISWLADGILREPVQEILLFTGAYQQDQRKYKYNVYRPHDNRI